MAPPLRGTKYNALPILISGTIGTGKSTLGKHLARQMKRSYISASDFHRALLEKQLHVTKQKANDPSFWETHGNDANHLRQKNHAHDRRVDREVMRALHAQPHSVTDARLAPWLHKGKAIRIWIQVSEKESARRVSGRDGMSVASVFPTIRKRYRADQALWKEIYGIEYGKDLSPFDLVINTEGFEKEDTYRIIHGFIQTKLAAQEKQDH